MRGPPEAKDFTEPTPCTSPRQPVAWSLGAVGTASSEAGASDACCYDAARRGCPPANGLGVPLEPKIIRLPLTDLLRIARLARIAHHTDSRCLADS